MECKVAAMDTGAQPAKRMPKQATSSNKNDIEHVDNVMRQPICSFNDDEELNNETDSDNEDSIHTTSGEYKKPTKEDLDFI